MVPTELIALSGVRHQSGIGIVVVAVAAVVAAATAAEQVNIGDPEKDGDEAQRSEDGVTEREGHDGGSGDEPGGGMTGRDVEAVAVGEFEPEAHKADECEETDAEHDIKRRKYPLE